MAQTTSPKWGPIKKKLGEFNHAELLDLIKDLYDYSADNKAFLTARFAEGGETAALEEYRQRIITQFFPKRRAMFPKPDLREARRAIREYRKATSDLAGTLDLMLTYVEAGTRFTNEYGDLWEAFYVSMETMLEEFSKLIQTPAAAGLYGEFRDRLLKLEAESRDTGWGYHDSISFEVNALEKALAPPPRS
jgi:Family of unknown function (DUF6155)